MLQRASNLGEYTSKSDNFRRTAFVSLSAFLLSLCMEILLQIDHRSSRVALLSVLRVMCIVKITVDERGVQMRPKIGVRTKARALLEER